MRFLDTIAANGALPDGGVLLSSRSTQIFFENRTKDLPEYYSPWPNTPLLYPYGRPDYGFSAWILAQNPDGVVEEVCSPGAFGTFPWIDRKRRIRGAVFTYVPNGFVVTGVNNLRILAAIRRENVKTPARRHRPAAR